GGGFPGIPLAIMFPETQFTLIDGTRKKITVVEEVVKAIGLENVTTRHTRAEDLKGHFDFVISRAVARLDKLVHWSFRLIRDKQQHPLPNGLLTLKGGDIKEEIKSLGRGSYTEVFPLTDFFDHPYFQEKCLVYVQW
ncbi:MAG: 16S rRNA (guanine(527)-N(7))-methyltransferase RsmG, partial [Lewinella sp.]|nr:16S rRNA (guanine(527)-N(7))-methyltransferase RsmG [Lewinella sp.]